MRRYLLVDDNRDFAENLAEILELRGHQAIVAHSGEKALRLIAEQRFDAMLTDMRMPEMSGAELIPAARRTDPELPIFVASAYSSEADLAAAQSQGIHALLPKPVDIPRLCGLLEAVQRGQPS